jgi:CRP/FNR family cyclic AMP-dependent transcriptional regulator
MPTPYGLAIPDSCVTCRLRTESFFCSLPASVLREFEKLKASTLLPKGAVLFVEGQIPRGMFMLCQGEVKLSTTASDGRPVILKVALSGEILGLSSCVSGVPYIVTAEAHTPCQTSFVKRQDFLRFLQQHGEACLQAARQLSVEHKHAVGAIRTLGRDHQANEKFAKFLLTLDEEGTNRLTLTLTHSEISEVLGISRETVTRAFADFKSAKWIAVDGPSISICNREALQRLIAA